MHKTAHSPLLNSRSGPGLAIYQGWRYQEMYQKQHREVVYSRNTHNWGGVARLQQGQQPETGGNCVLGSYVPFGTKRIGLRLTRHGWSVL